MQMNDEDFAKLKSHMLEGKSMMWLNYAGKRDMRYVKTEYPSTIELAAETLH